MKIARELRTSVAYLMGDTDDPDSDLSHEEFLSVEERELVDRYRLMSEADRTALMHVARSMGPLPPPPPKSTLHSPKLAYTAPGPAGKP